LGPLKQVQGADAFADQPQEAGGGQDCDKEEEAALAALAALKAVIAALKEFAGGEMGVKTGLKRAPVLSPVNPEAGVAHFSGGPPNEVATQHSKIRISRKRGKSNGRRRLGS
jgi:hypothetical protein